MLAVDDDSSYADADDVSGDIVLEERQTRYAANGDEAVLSVVIERHHDD